MDSAIHKSDQGNALTERDWEILTQCLAAAIEGPFFKGLLYRESEVAYVIGAEWEQLKLILSYWPDLEARDLQVKYEILQEQSSSFIPTPRPVGRFNSADAVKMPIRLKIYSVAEHCFYNLLREVNWPRETERQRQALATWKEYIEVPPREAWEVGYRWQQIYRPYRLR